MCRFPCAAKAEHFLKKLGDLPREILTADNQEFSFGETKLRFSAPVFHGTGPKLGCVVQVCVQEEFKFLHTSDVQGPVMADQRGFLLQEDPQVVFCDGPVTYMLGRRYSVESLRQATGNLSHIVEKTQIQKLILDHHLLRELGWKERIKEVFAAAKLRGVEMLTAAEFAGLKNDLLEAGRKRLYGH